MSIVRFPRAPRYQPRCRACGARFNQLAPHHEYCPRCYRGAQLYRACVQYREATK